jgi:hypothetical protein
VPVDVHQERVANVVPPLTATEKAAGFDDWDDDIPF